jgi:uncharacterized membrane protein YfcA
MDIIKFVAIGLTIGSLSGALGIGGGVLLIPALIWLCKFEPHQAAGTTLAILVPPIGLPAAWNYYCRGQVNLMAALWIAIAFAAGAFGGSWVVKYADELTLRLLFGLAMIYIAMRMIVSSNSEVANAAAGLTAMVFAWLAFVGLRLLGRRHLPRPNLGEQIQSMADQGRGDPDYYI